MAERLRESVLEMKSLLSVCGKDVRVMGTLLRIAQLEGDGYEFLETPEPILAGLRRAGVRIDLFTFLQKLPESRVKYPYAMEWDNLAALPVTTFEDWWKHQIRPEARNRARQAEKNGVVIREVPFGDALVKGIWEIYNECPIRQGRRFPHYGKDIKTVCAEAATFLDSSHFIGAFLHDKLIGFVKLTTDETRTQANLMNILSLVKYRHIAPTNALIAYSVRMCAEKRISYLVYQRFSYGKKRADGLTRFKEVNGFRKFDLPRYYVSLTLRGRIAYRLGLHHRFVDRFPGPVATSLRDLRNSWYSRNTLLAKKPV